MDGWLGAVIIIMDTLNLENIQQLQQGLKNPDTKNIWDIHYTSYIYLQIGWSIFYPQRVEKKTQLFKFSFKEYEMSL